MCLCLVQIDIDIEPTDKVRRYTLLNSVVGIIIWTNVFCLGGKNQRESGGEGGNSPTTTKVRTDTITHYKMHK